MSAYEIAKAGGRHGGLIRRFSKEREPLIEKSFRSLGRMIQEHRQIKNPMAYVGPDISSVHFRDFIESYWPEEIENFRRHIEGLNGKFVVSLQTEDVGELSGEDITLSRLYEAVEVEAGNWDDANHRRIRRGLPLPGCVV